MLALNRLGAPAVLAALVGSATLLAANPAKAWWVGGFRFGVVLQPIVAAPAPVYVAPPVTYVPPPVYYAPPPRRVWVPGHWQGGYWVPPHRA